MHLALTFLLAFVAVANAHFQLHFPTPRGVFNAANEVNFCDSYSTTTNRSSFPLEGGFFTFRAGHGHWTAGIIVSTAEDPTSFDNFTQLVPFFANDNAGEFCVPLNFSTPVNGTTFRDGQNVTIQMVFSGGDGNLYQCADLTLQNNFTIASNVTCANVTATATSSSATASATQTSGAMGNSLSVGLAALMIVVFSVVSTF